MPLSALTDPGAVEKALDEFDRLSRERFLEKYGFGEARSYFVLRNGRLYDSKAIAAAAHGLQHPQIGALGPYDFSGGERTVATLLRRLGFVVSELDETSRESQAWAFCANPGRYDIQSAIKDPGEDSWVTDGRDVRKGDVAIVWQTKDRSGRRGIVAIANVVSEATVRDDAKNRYWLKPGEAATREARVGVRYVTPSALPIWVDDTLLGKKMASLAVAKAQGGTVFYVTSEQWQDIRDAISWQETTEELVIEELVRPQSREGQGRGLTHAERMAVEMRAMDVVRQCLEREWTTVSDVSKSRSYDFACKNGLEILRVEVKGTITDGAKVLLTYREVEEASKPGYALFVVSNIQLDRSKPSSPQATGGRCRRVSPWELSAHVLKPITYTCSLNWSYGVDIP